MMKKKTIGFFIVFCCVSFFILTGCEKDEENIYNISASMNGSKEVPNPTPSTGTGTVTGTYDADDNVLTYTASWTGLTATASAAHFHGPASTTETASPIVTFTIVGNGATGVVTLTDQQEQDLLSGLWYVNVHTPNHTAGEIRGQVSATK